MYRGAIKSILSELVRQDRLVVVEKFELDAPKTKVLVQKLKDLAVEDALIITASLDENLFLAARNLYKVDVRDVQGIDPVSLIAFDKVIVTVDAVKQIEEILKMSQERLLSVLRAPHISEKATNNAEKSNTVVLKVALDANKAEIAAAVAQLFEVKVDSVRTVVVKGKTKRRGNKMGRRSDWKKLM